ncbi:ArdC-like ssDNA-binding domain-containing protein [Halomarina salina]|uniref:ArdC-like ssDNA-binding domain-containing protein n=1 Tax=Halomarina salina TaxID=1872699 RepID=A0ABD5RTX2_9EURY|nr:ArdC-like ssDNA-binding domain-containing protein [Halomarina salina]
MSGAIDDWLDQLREGVDDAETNEQFQQWLDVMSRFHEYSMQNQLLIALQRPDATRVAGFNTWREEFDRTVQKGEQAIWIWAPIMAKQCPACGNSPSYCADSACEGSEIPTDEWERGVVAFKPVPVFDVSQTEGDPLPEVDIAAHGDASTLSPALAAVAQERGYDYSLVPEAEWSHGSAKGVCAPMSDPPVIEVLERGNTADQARTTIHEFAHAELHAERSDDATSTTEVEAEAVAYVVAQYVGLDASTSALYVAAWSDGAVDTIDERLGRIQWTARELIEAIERQFDA